LAAFVHLPLVKRPSSVHRRLRGNERRFTADDLFKVGSRLLSEIAAAVNRT
jgi:hypothetical protein